MQGVIFAVKHFEIHDGDGIRTTVFFKGCPLRCPWCHNPEGLEKRAQLAFSPDRCVSCGRCAALCPAHSLESHRHTLDRAACHACGRCAEECPTGALTLYGRSVQPEELLEELLADRPYYQASGGGVTLSGGEPMAQPLFAAGMLRMLKKQGIHTALDTSGYAEWKDYESVLPDTDQILYDIKAMDEAVHRRLTGRSNAIILENLKRLDGAGIPTDIRIPLVPGQNDGEIPAIGRFLASLRRVRSVTVLPYHELSASLYEALGRPYVLRGTPLPTLEQVSAAVGLLRGLGLPAADHRG